MNIREFADIAELESFQAAWTKATGISTVVVDGEGEALAGDYIIADQTVEKENTGCYKTADGGIEFAYPIVVHALDEVAMTIYGGLDKADDDSAMGKVEAFAELLSLTMDSIVNQKYYEFIENKKMTVYGANLEKINGVIDRINDNSKKLTKIASKQGILALNSAIEAARLGTAGASFSILAKQESDLSKQSGEIYEQIGDDINIISEAVNEMNYAKDHDGETAPTINVEDLLLDVE